MIHIGIISDGKPGHLNQTRGLAEAISRLQPTAIHQIDLCDGSFWKKTQHALEQIRTLPQLHFLFAAGHRTHLPLVALRQITDTPAIVLMKPSLPYALFDLALVPQHDLRKRIPESVLPTVGALNRVIPHATKQAQGLILLGGPSRDFAWQPEEIRQAIEQIMANSPLRWSITDSRRTPQGYLDTLRDLPLSIHPHESCGSHWLPAQLSDATEVWVTEESVSMIFESLTSGAKVGLLPMKPLSEGAKIKRLVQSLKDQGYCADWQHWQKVGTLPKPPNILAEADRCAAIILQNFYPELL